MKNYFERVTSIGVALLFFQTLYFKFSGAPVSIYIFSSLKLEPIGRIGVGIVELIIGLLLFNKKTSFFGAIMGSIIILVAIIIHIFIIGINVHEDNGLLFYLALTIFILCLINIYIQKEKLFNLIDKIIS